MSDFVVDASVALKCVFDEEHAAAARNLIIDARDDRRPLAPPILSSEGTNAIYQRERRGRLTAAQAEELLEAFVALPIQLVAPPDLYQRALELSRRYKLPATYDSQYLALALESDAEFWTADQRLYNALPRSLRWVHAIEEFSLP